MSLEELFILHNAKLPRQVMANYSDYEKKRKGIVAIPLKTLPVSFETHVRTEIFSLSIAFAN